MIDYHIMCTRMKGVRAVKKAAVRGLLTAALVCGLCLLLSGCFIQSMDEMYTIPRASEEYQNLDSVIKAVMNELGAEYAAPISGDNTQTIQLQDLDGNGDRETAVAFFRVNNAEKPLKIYIFTRQPDESYLPTCVIEGEGTSIYAIRYEDLGGSPASEIIVSWQMSANVNTLCAYSISGREAVELMRSSYSRCQITDMDRDNSKEVVLLQLDLSGETASRAELYDYDGSVMALTSSAPLSAGITEIKSVRRSNLVDSVPAIFVYSGYGDDRSQVVDVFALREGQLKNLLLDPETGITTEVMQYYIMSGQDINNDTILEVPQSEPLPEYISSGATPPAAPNYWVLNWRQFDLEGNTIPVYTTYHNTSDGWYLILPDEWDGKITVSRRDLSTTGERRVVFSRWNGSDTEPTAFLTIYTLTGANRQYRATMGGRQILLNTGSTIYAYEFATTEGWDCGLDGDGLAARFALIRTEWSTE